MYCSINITEKLYLPSISIFTCRKLDLNKWRFKSSGILFRVDW